MLQHFVAKGQIVNSSFFIFQAVQLDNRERLISFCEVVQQTCPVGSFIEPTAGETPGYASEVGCLLSTIELCLLFIILFVLNVKDSLLHTLYC
jgi:hypothetical protein